MMGELVSRNATGSFYLVTTNQSPFFLKSNKTELAADPMNELADYPSLKAMAVSGTPGFIESAGALIG